MLLRLCRVRAQERDERLDGAGVGERDLVLEIVDAFTGACLTDTRTIDGAVPEVEPTVLYALPLESGVAEVVSLSIAPDHASRLVVWVRPSDPAGLGHGGVAIAAPIHVRSRP